MHIVMSQNICLVQRDNVITRSGLMPRVMGEGLSPCFWFWLLWFAYLITYNHDEHDGALRMHCQTSYMYGLLGFDGSSIVCPRTCGGK